MTDTEVLDVASEMIFTIFKCALPLLLVSLVVGLAVSIFQTVTSIQEQTLTFVPKLIAIFLTLLLCGEYIMTTCVQLFQDICYSFSTYTTGG